MRVTTIILILAAVAGLAYWMGWLKIGPGGAEVAVDVPDPMASPDVQYAFASKSFNAGEFETAIEWYRNALTADPTHEDAEQALWHIARANHQLAEHHGRPELWPPAAAAYAMYLREFPQGKWAGNCRNQMQDPAIAQHL